MENKFLVLWRELESSGTRPTRINQLREIEFEELSRKVIAQESVFVEKLVHSLWSGDVYLVKRAFSKDWVENIKESTQLFFQEHPDSFHKMLENCPDFHRLIDAEITKKYSVDAVKHAAYFFPWNKDPLNLFKPVWKRWGVYKLLGGRSFDEYVHNTPKDGVIDRIQICVYPSGAGGLGTHADAYVNQRVFISVYLSKRGEDYLEGGFYAIDQNNRSVDLEPEIEVGDMGFGYASILHGVHPIDPVEKTDWNNSGKGRWFMGLYSIDSDETSGKRRTSTRVTVIEDK